jgi:hypothetical protein
VLYEMCTGTLPFRCDTAALVFNAILERAPVAPGFIVSTFSLLRFLLYGKEERIFPCWSSTSSLISQEKQERVSVG